jgi:AraC family transcriptional regulator
LATAANQAIGEQRLSGGEFYGRVLGRSAVGGAIFTELQHSCPRSLPAHSHELPFFCLFISGDYQEKFGRNNVQFRPFTFSFRPAGVPHQDAIGPHGARMFGIEIERAWQKRMESCSGSLNVGYDFEGGAANWLAVQLYFETQTKLPADDLQVESLLSELLGVVACRPENCRIAPLWLQRIREKLNAEFRDRITMNELAREAGVHPVHVSRVFRRFNGRGIGEYVHRLRIREACERMLNPEASLADISCDLGFADQSHFSRTFLAITGRTPAAFRATLARESVTSLASLCHRPFSSSAHRCPLSIPTTIRSNQDYETG